MKPLTCLLLLAAVLSFDALNAAYVEEEGDDTDFCKALNGSQEEDACRHCCNLRGRDSNWSTRWGYVYHAWHNDGLCVCRKTLLFISEPTPSLIKLWEAKYQAGLNSIALRGPTSQLSINSEPDKASPSE
jgi:hypothetical protein